MQIDKTGIAEKYDREAASYSRRFAAPGQIAARYLDLLNDWGTRIQPGAEILEVGCADGFLTELLCRTGYRVTAIDLSAEMINRAKSRLSSAGLDAKFMVADVEEIGEIDVGPFDATVALLRTFFRFTQEPEATLRLLRNITRAKILVDVNPRYADRSLAMQWLKEAGFPSVSWRPLFAPQNRAVPSLLKGPVTAAERIPIIRSIPLRYKFNVVLKGEGAEA